MPPAWLEILSCASIVAALACALAIAADVARRPQPMAIMNWVWPITALYFGPVALWAYWRMARQPAPRQGGAGHAARVHAGGKPGAHAGEGRATWRSAFVGATHCGAGCVLGDLAGEWLVFAAGITLFGAALWADFVADFVFAYGLGIVFQYFAIAPMRDLRLRDGLIAAIKADSASLVAFELGMFAWMYVAHRILFPGLAPTRWTYWFMMQIAMVVGFWTTMPVNGWLIRRGLKEAM